MIFGGQDEGQLLRRVGGEIILVGEAVEHLRDDFQFFQHEGHGLLLRHGRIALAAAVGVEGEGFFQVGGDAQVIDDQAARFVFVDAVDAGDGLHQVVALHRFVDVHGVQGGHIEAGQPHIAHDDQFQRIVGVFHAVGQGAALFFVGVVQGDFGAIGGSGGHDHFDDAFVQVVAVPVGAQGDDLAVEGGGDAAGHGHDHAFAVKDFLPLLKMGDDVAGDVFEPLFAADQRFQLRPFGLGFLGVGQVFFVQFFVQVADQFAPGGAQFDFGQAAFVVDAHRGPIFDGLGDVVDVDIVAEDGGGVDIGRFDGRAGEAEIGGIGQGVAQIFGEAVDDFLADDVALLVFVVDDFGLEAVLGAVGFVGDDDDVVAVRRGFRRRCLLRVGISGWW